jgi:hypothetical protein
MPIKAIVEDINQVEEPQRALYKETDGKFVLDVEPVGGYALEDVGGLKTALGATRRERDDAMAALKPFEGIDPDKARDAFKRVDEFAKFDPEKEADKIVAGKVEAMKSQLIEQHTAETRKLSERVSVFESAARRLGVTDRISKALDKAGATPEGRDVLEAYMAKFVKAGFTEDAALKIDVVDDKGNPRIKNAEGEAMSIEDLAEELRTKMPANFQASSRGGSGATPSPNGGSSVTTKKRSEMSNAEKGKFIAEHGYKTYMALPA